MLLGHNICHPYIVSYVETHLQTHWMQSIGTFWPHSPKKHKVKCPTLILLPRLKTSIVTNS